MMHCTLRALAAQFLLLSSLSVQNFVTAQADSSATTTTTTVTSTMVVMTAYVVLTKGGSSYSSLTTVTESTIVGATGGSTLIVGTSVPTNYPASSVLPQPSRPTGSMSYSSAAFQAAVLNSTNYYRAQHQALPLLWETSLAHYAQDHAQKCVFAHSGGSNGENLASNFATPTLAIDAWAAEEKYYNYEKEGFTEAAGHYTQLVWEGTTSVGCGVAQCNGLGGNGASGWFMVCEYSPKGNVAGAFGANVGKLGEAKDGEPGLGAARRLGETGKWIVALVAAGLTTGLCI